MSASDPSEANDANNASDEIGANDANDANNANDLMLAYFAVSRLYDDYASCIDEDRLEAWPDFFTEQCRYEIKPRENEIAGLPIAAMLCDSRAMLIDRVVALRRANIFTPHVYRHFMSALQITAIDPETITCSANYLIVQTLEDGESRIFQVGRMRDVIERHQRNERSAHPLGLRFRSRIAIYDTSRVQTLLVRPV